MVIHLKDGGVCVHLNSRPEGSERSGLLLFFLSSFCPFLQCKELHTLNSSTRHSFSHSLSCLSFSSPAICSSSLAVFFSFIHDLSFLLIFIFFSHSLFSFFLSLSISFFISSICPPLYVIGFFLSLSLSLSLFLFLFLLSFFLSFSLWFFSSSIRLMSDFDKWENQQLLHSGLLSREEHPLYDEDLGILPSTEVEEDVEIEIREDEPLFLRGQTTRTGMQLSPVKILANPDGSLARAAATATALSKERREIRNAQESAILDSIPKDMSRPWEDPAPGPGERTIAQALKVSRDRNNNRQVW